jgi:adenosylhomocysteine nucleosidase
MLGIIGAMDVETDYIKSMVKDAEISHFAGADFVCGKIGDTPVCVVRCGVGKVNAALCTQAMLDNFDIDRVVNVGCACSLSRDVVIRDVVVATEVCEHDFDTSPIDGVRGLIVDGKVKLPTDKELTAAFAKSAQECGFNCHLGVIASGDVFISSQEMKDDIVSTFGAICGEMEGAAIGHVCYVNSMPFAVLRSISDGGDDDAQLDYPSFKKIAADISTKILLNFLGA